MSLIEAARAAQKPHGPPCSISLLDPALVAEIEEAMEDPSIYTTTIAAVLRERGFEIANAQLQRHRRRDCRCR